ncbi:MAG: IS481 family transposase [Chloroflexi bacterium]|nr:IS481 family transposase [Chloroflexota bacterium]
MPWKDIQVLDQRMSFIVAYRRGEDSLAAVCRRFGVSRKTGRKWVERYCESGPEGLLDRSRAPHRHPNAVGADIVQLVIMAKHEHPAWGPRKLIPWLRRRHPEIELPAPSTAGEILWRHDLVQPRKRVRRTDPWTRPFEDCTAPNETWCIDFKGWFRTLDGVRCDPLTITDAYSRMLLCCRGLESQNGRLVRSEMERVFREYGLPATIRSDNGTPFASTALGGLSRLSVYWIKLGIMPERIRPGHPEENGRHERMHRTLKAETIARPMPNMPAQQKVFDSFRLEFNEERPHEALGQNPPASLYRPSERSYPSRMREIEYASEMTVRRVRTSGEIKWKGGLLYLSEALVGEPVGLVPESERHLAIYFGPLKLCLMDQSTHQLVRIAPEWKQ